MSWWVYDLPWYFHATINHILIWKIDLNQKKWLLRKGYINSNISYNCRSTLQAHVVPTWKGLSSQWFIVEW
jgi:hypothetical protein